MSDVPTLLAKLRDLRVVDLSQTLEEHMPNFPTHSMFFHNLWSSYERGGRSLHYQLNMHEHNGTHVDAPIHFLAKAKPEAYVTIDRVPLAQLMGRGVRVDCRDTKAGEYVSKSRLQEWEGPHGLLQAGDIVLFDFGWAGKWGLRPNNQPYIDNWPGVGMDAAEYLLLKQVAAIGVDTLSPDPPEALRAEPIHPVVLEKQVLIIGYREALAHAARRPFRVVPFFDPGPWGGEWMRRHFNLPAGPPNFAWCFDCVPEENGLRFAFGAHVVETPALPLVHEHAHELLGAEIVRRFGAEFPIRFDFLDTVEGGNLSLQVHPLRAYIAEHFGMDYTQDESYYLLDAEPDAVVYLGLKPGIDSARMAQDLEAAQAGGPPFPAEQYVNAWPARKHDHFLIPAGTIHCSGRNCMVLEISATPYIFTFKLWDWARLGLNGFPRPIHLKHGLANLQWNRDRDWVRANLVNQVRPVAEGAGWREESTGLHELEFLETRRHWFTGPVPHHTAGTLNVLNLVEGDEAVVESPAGAFEPFVVHYAETFIVPACIGPYRIAPTRPADKPLGTIKAYVREEERA